MKITLELYALQRHQFSDSDDSDIWDDTALIKAYDNAVDNIKAQLDDKMDSEQSPSNEKVNCQQSRKSKKQTKKKNKCKWKVGDECLATYTEDCLLYEAKIISVNYEDDTCFVRYSGYGNEEQQKLCDLLLPDPKSFTSDVQVDSSKFYHNEPAQSQKSHKKRSGKNKSAKGKNCDKTSSNPWMPPFLGMPNGANPFAGMYAPPWAGMPSPHRHMNLPNIPPPPPPMASWDMDNNEALCSMLMSWYMSGYHTGYYQGLKSKQN
ncbi:survival motor neuron protein isoform X1 [Octopus bimaculoides]|uniref:survival motor neuron protein isoform X1 n=2 Tax=Octopus bimaculoides TaxID=37653 RepID=UPI00071D63C3|nr:survival motor neuron protein isoform X1 [Octopus bimaculoides]|eukprot:XP_014773931.1 PREDICTED: survival motor neuron protein-like isoform X1 [Octopus bimaculoides]